MNLRNIPGRISRAMMLIGLTALVLAATPSTASAVEAEAGTLNGTARVVSCSTCSGGARVGYIGTGSANWVRVPVSAAAAGTYTMTIRATVSGTRTFYTSVNGGSGPTISVSGTSWTTPVTRTASVTLIAGTNTIRFYNNSAAAPDLDAVTVSGRKFLFGMRGDSTGREDMAAVTSDPKVINEIMIDLARPIAQRRHINGAIARGNNGNLWWSWHFKPNEWALAHFSIEVCDGRPASVEADLDYWVDRVGRFCPYSSYVKREIAP